MVSFFQERGHLLRPSILFRMCPGRRFRATRGLAVGWRILSRSLGGHCKLSGIVLWRVSAAGKTFITQKKAARLEWQTMKGVAEPDIESRGQGKSPALDLGSQFCRERVMRADSHPCATEGTPQCAGGGIAGTDVTHGRGKCLFHSPDVGIGDIEDRRNLEAGITTIRACGRRFGGCR